MDIHLTIYDVIVSAHLQNAVAQMKQHGRIRVSELKLDLDILTLAKVRDESSGHDTENAREWRLVDHGSSVELPVDELCVFEDVGQQVVAPVRTRLLRHLLLERSRANIVSFLVEAIHTQYVSAQF